MTEEERLKDVGVRVEDHVPEERKSEGGVRGWWGRLGRAAERSAAPCQRGRLGAVLGAEAAGTLLLVLLVCAPACLSAEPPPLATRALATGATVALLVQCFDHISTAMFNPAVSLTALLLGRLGARRLALVLCAQLAGALLGAVLASALAAHPGAAAHCLTKPHQLLHPFKAVVWECVATACLCLANCAAWDSRTAGRAESWPLRIGTAVTALVFAIGDLTGASMNPARSVGPALVAADPHHHWVYWAGPALGAVLAAALYRAAWLPPAPPAPAPGRFRRASNKKF